MINPFIPHVTDKRQQRMQKILEHWYPTPNPYRTLEEYFKFTHQDLRNLSIAELKTELVRVRDRLANDPRPPEWLLTRLSTLRRRLHEP